MKSIIECKVSYQCGTKGVFNSAHNTRDFDRDLWNIDGHIHYDKTNLNCVLLHKPPDIEWLKAHGFEEKIKAFDEAPTQKKNKSRRIGSLENFLKAHLNDSREIIVQLGDGDSGENSRNNFKDLCEQVGEERAREIYTEFFKRALEQIQRENPSFYIWGAYIHFDETTPHMHVDYLPLSESKNVKQAFSLDGALKSMGFARKQHQTKGEHWTAWQADRRAKIEALANEVVSEFAEEVEIKILPSEPWDKSKRRQTTSQHRAEQAEKKAKAAEERTKSAEQKAEQAEQKAKAAEDKLSKTQDKNDYLSKENAYIKQDTEDYVRSLEPEPTKTVKKFGREKTVDKTPEEIERDKEVKAAQAVLQDRDKVTKKLAELETYEQDFTKYVNDREKEYVEKETQLREDFQRKETQMREDFQHQLDAKTAEVDKDKAELARQLKAAKDAQFAATVQQEVYKLACVPLPTAAEVLARNYEREQQQTKGANKQWQR